MRAVPSDRGPRTCDEAPASQTAYMEKNQVWPRDSFVLFYPVPQGRDLQRTKRITGSSENRARIELFLACPPFSFSQGTSSQTQTAQSTGQRKPQGSAHLWRGLSRSLIPLMQTQITFLESSICAPNSDSHLSRLLIIPPHLLVLFFLPRHIILYPRHTYALCVLSSEEVLWV